MLFIFNKLFVRYYSDFSKNHNNSVLIESNKTTKPNTNTESIFNESMIATQPLNLLNEKLYTEPVKFYVNAESDKFIILKENKYKSGIYQWVNLITGYFYIGSSSNLRDKLARYYQDAYIANTLKGNNRIIRALKKYGHSNFSLSILEYCDKDNLIKRTILS